MIRQFMTTVCAAIVFFTSTFEVRADCVPERRSSIPSTQVTEPKQAIAIKRFQMGNGLLQDKDYEGALDLFLKSRAAWYHWASTINAAICYAELGHSSDALALYEEVMAYFPTEIPPAVRAQIVEAIAKLKRRVLVLRIPQSSGIFSIDGETCGALPRAEPVYLLPGPHVLRVSRPGETDENVPFDGHSGASFEVSLPRHPPPLSLNSEVSLPDPQGHWFVQGSVGPAIGIVNLDSSSDALSSIGFLLQTRDGYRFPNDLSLALNMGLFYMRPTPNAPISASNTGIQIDGTGNTNLTFHQDRPTFAPFMGVSAGWEPSLGSGAHALFRAGIGLMGAQSKSVIEVQQGNLRLPIDEAFLCNTTDASPACVSGREIVKSVPPYASIDMGIEWKLKQMRLGLTISALLVLDRGPELPKVPILLQNGTESTAFNLGASNSYSSMLLLVPLLFFGFDL